MARGKKDKGDRKATLSYQVVDASDGLGREMYDMLHQLVDEHHSELIGASIALAWATKWKADPDGRLKLGVCKKVNDPERALMGHDFVVILNKDFWTNPTVEDWQRKALLDHELCHAQVKYDPDGEPVEDEKGRKVYRIRKHDVEEFSEIIARHGTYKKNLEDFAKALMRSKQRPLKFEPRGEEEEQPTPSNVGISGAEATH